jgi:transglutaminase-like putative cysteine protease
MDVIQSKKGDCTAYALLFTTLARAAGIPAREAGGWLYMGDEYQAFGFHAWNEVILDGHWVPVDASCKGTFNAGHIQECSADGEGSRLREMVPGLKARVISCKIK